MLKTGDTRRGADHDAAVARGEGRARDCSHATLAANLGGVLNSAVAIGSAVQQLFSKDPRRS